MPVGIISKGGQNWKADLAPTKKDAINALENIQRHLSRPGKASGVLTIVNRSKQGAELQLERKNSFQLWGRGSNNQRLNDTSHTVKTLLQRAGMDSALNELETYLSADDHSPNRVSAKKMLELLNTYLPAAQEVEMWESVGRGNPEIERLFPRYDDSLDKSDIKQSERPAKDLSFERKAQDGKDLSVEPSVQVGRVLSFQQSQSDSAVPNVDDIMPELAELHRAAEQGYLPLQPRSSHPPLPYPAKAEASSLNELLQTGGIALVDKGLDGSPSVAGKGAFGLVNHVTVEGEPRLLKTFHKDEAPVLSLDRNGYPNEAVAAYLTSKKNPDYAKRLNVIQPEYFLISSGGRFLMVDPLGLRALIKASPANQIKCHALIMKTAEGDEIKKIKDKLTQDQRKKIFKGTIEAIKVMNQRGFVHRDIKPANAFFDSSSGKVTLIDTGMLHKVSKNTQASRQLTDYAGTPLYMHPKILTGVPYGTEADLYAAAMMTLELEHPALTDLIVDEYVDQEVISVDAGHYGSPKTRFFNRDELLKLLEVRIATAQFWDSRPIPSEKIENLKQFKQELEQPDSFASLIIDTMLLATETVGKRMVRGNRLMGAAQNPQKPTGQAGIDWASPEKAQEVYNKLLADPRF